jgi:transcription elongation factor B subunit 1
MKVKLSRLSFNSFRSHVVERVCKYLTYKAYYSKSNSDVPEFPLPAEVAVDLLEAAMFLMC